MNEIVTIRRLATGVPGLADILGDGLRSGGKTLLGTAFLAEGVRRGEPGVLVAFEQTPSQSWNPAIFNLGVTALMTSELEDHYIDLRVSSYGSAVLTDATMVQRYFELDSFLTRVMGLVKVRDSAHSAEIRQCSINGGRSVIGDTIREYEGLLGGRSHQASAGSRDTERKEEFLS